MEGGGKEWKEAEGVEGVEGGGKEWEEGVKNGKDGIEKRRESEIGWEMARGLRIQYLS